MSLLIKKTVVPCIADVLFFISSNNVGNAGPHVRQTFLNDVFTFLTEVGNAGRIVNTGTNSVNSEFVTALNT
jgi:ABC-type enterochelin transport system substrate-binding protein